MNPLTALQMEGRDIYIREGCHVCHTQMVRRCAPKPNAVTATTPSRANRCGSIPSCGAPSVPARIWPASAASTQRLAPRPPDESARRGSGIEHARFPWLATNKLDGELTGKKLALFRDHFGVPYTRADIDGAKAAAQGRPKWRR